MTTPQIELVNTEAHKDVRVNTRQYNTAENRVNAAVVTAGELNALCHEYPIFATKNPNTKQFQLIAILGLHTGENLFLDGDKWRATYIPLDILRKPFQAYVPDPTDASKGSIAINMDSEVVGYENGEALFTESGESTDYFKRIESTFAQLMGGSKYTSELLGQADEMGLLSSVSLNIDLADGSQTSINGVYAFDKEKVSALSGKELELCHESGILQICHLVLSSGIHLDKLINWHGQKQD